MHSETEATRVMREAVEAVFAYMRTDPKVSARLTGRMQPEFHSCSAEEHVLTVAYPVTEEELNPNGTMMGGFISAAADATAGTLAYTLCGNKFPPTVSLMLNFARPVLFGDRLLMCARVSHAGGRLLYLTAEGRSEKDGGVCVTASAVFLRV